jgi:P27 family predicted phage terminase small subunit
MTKGRLPKLREMKALQGTDRKDRQVDPIEFTIINIVPKPEVWLDAKAKKYFKNFCRLLIEKQLLTNANIGHVVIMAQEFSTYEKANRELQKKENGEVITTNTGYKQPSPWIAIRNNAQQNYRNIASLFGLDPVSAMKVGGAKKAPKDPFEEMQNKYNQ